MALLLGAHNYTDHLRFALPEICWRVTSIVSTPNTSENISTFNGHANYRKSAEGERILGLLAIAFGRLVGQHIENAVYLMKEMSESIVHIHEAGQSAHREQYI